MSVTRTETAEYVLYEDGGATTRVYKETPPRIESIVVCDDARILARNAESATWQTLVAHLDTLDGLL